MTEALLILIRDRTPAGTTTLLVSPGLFTATRELASIAGGIVLGTVVAWAINRALGAPAPVWAPGRDRSG